MFPQCLDRSRLALVVGCSLLLAPLLLDYGLDAPTPIGAFLNDALPRRTPTGTARLAVRPAFPNLRFDDTTVIRPAPNSDRLYIGSRAGVIHSIENNRNTTVKEPFLDISDRVAVVWDGGFLGLAFHPEFGVPGSPNRGRFFTYYCATDTGNYPRQPTAGFFGVYLRLSRFWVPDGSTVADPTSEEVMINIRLYNSSHRGGDITFGPDRYLYVPFGESFNFETAQDIVNNLEGGIMRIDVDANPGRSHAPRRKLPLALSDEISGRHYWIPNDNPFLDINGGVFEEYYSLGHRNPHRLTFDPATGRLWSGEIGSWVKEEVNVIFKGDNNGWPFREGTQPGPRQPPPTIVGNLRNPVVDFGRAEANAIIGGYVYRGSQQPQLVGKYICGDYVTRNLWALTYNPSTHTATKQLLAAFDPDLLATFGQDHAGEVYMGALGSGKPIYKLATIIDYVGDAPPLLSQTGAFTDLQKLTPAPGLIPYDVNSPLWSDGAVKRRWIAIANDGIHDTPAETIEFSETGSWGFPNGTVLIKHFEMPLDERNPAVTRRLETRFLVKGEDGVVYGLTYRWRPDGSEADLLTEGATEALMVQTAKGTRTQFWTYPDRNECMSCHTAAAGRVLGVRTHQLNRDFTYPSTGRTDNQLRTWNHLGVFVAALDEQDIGQMPTARPVGDMSASLEDRARAYLDVNCAHCHQPGTANRGQFDARLMTPLLAQKLVHGTVVDDLGTPGAGVVEPRDLQRSILHRRLSALDSTAMPPLAKGLLDEAGLELMAQWIGGLSQDLEPFTLGNPVSSAPSSDVWMFNLVVDESDAYVNDTGVPIDVGVAAFRFWAGARAGAVTPFVVKVVGDNDFRVVAIGTPRLDSEYRIGENTFRFDAAREPLLRVLPGEKLAVGFYDALPDGTGGAAGGVIPYCTCNGGDEFWSTGSLDEIDAPRLILGIHPARGPLTEDGIRDYAFAIDFAVRRRASTTGRFNFRLDAPFQLGYPVRDGTLGAWQTSVVVGQSSSFTNNTSQPQSIDVMLFRFWAAQAGSPVTPFVVKRRGAEDFQVVAIGTTRTAQDYAQGPNLFLFHDSGLVRIVLAPGETLATGFLDAAADGSGNAGPVIPYRTGDLVWLSGGPSAADAGRVQFGRAVFPGAQVPPMPESRNYAYAIDFLLR